MPHQTPMLPPMAASRSNDASEMRHLSCLALYLSMPYAMNVTILIIRRYMSRVVVRILAQFLSVLWMDDSHSLVVVTLPVFQTQI